jgi:beta-glucosidase-like glycosyl hydrolase
MVDEVLYLATWDAPGLVSRFYADVPGCRRYDMEGYNDGGCHTHDGSCGHEPPPSPHADYRCDTLESGGCNRRNFDASPPMRDLVSYYTAPFKAISQRAKPAAVMCAYPALYGIPSCAQPFHNQVLRGEWGWDGFITSDCSAIALMSARDYFNYSGHNYTSSHVGTVQAALVQGGTDMDCPAGLNYYSTYMMDALNSGAVQKADIDRAARRVLRVMMRLGMMDPMDEQILVRYGAKDVDNELSRSVALRAAQQSIVPPPPNKSAHSCWPA